MIFFGWKNAKVIANFTTKTYKINVVMSVISGTSFTKSI